MPIVEIETHIKADLHSISTAKTNEIAIGGVTSGLINFGETVTWQATHFGIKQKLTSKITAFERPFHFRDEQQQGVFKLIYHDHYFETKNGIVIMKDVFKFQSPFGFIGKAFDKLILQYFDGHPTLFDNLGYILVRILFNSKNY